MVASALGLDRRFKYSGAVQWYGDFMPVEDNMGNSEYEAKAKIQGCVLLSMGRVKGTQFPDHSQPVEPKKKYSIHNFADFFAREATGDPLADEDVAQRLAEAKTIIKQMESALIANEV